MSSTATSPTPPTPNRFAISRAEIEQHENDRARLKMLGCDTRGCTLTVHEGPVVGLGIGLTVIHNTDHESFEPMLFAHPGECMVGTWVDTGIGPTPMRFAYLMPRDVAEWIVSLHAAADARLAYEDGWVAHARMLAGTL